MYMLYLLKKYGDTPRKPVFYGEKYFRAFPTLYVAPDEDEDDEEEDLEDEDSEGYLAAQYIPDPEVERMDCQIARHSVAARFL
jgi:hypothetical protein